MFDRRDIFKVKEDIQYTTVHHTMCHSPRQRAGTVMVRHAICFFSFIHGDY